MVAPAGTLATRSKRMSARLMEFSAWAVLPAKMCSPAPFAGVPVGDWYKVASAEAGMLTVTALEGRMQARTKRLATDSRAGVDFMAAG